MTSLFVPGASFYFPFSPLQPVIAMYLFVDGTIDRFPKRITKCACGGTYVYAGEQWWGEGAHPLLRLSP